MSCWQLAGGCAAVQTLRLTVNELQMMPIRRAVHLPVDSLMAHMKGGDAEAALEASNPAADLMIADLMWWTEALRDARAKA